MAELSASGPTNEPLFKSHKRKRVFRRRDDNDEDDTAPAPLAIAPTTTIVSSQVTRAATPACAPPPATSSDMDTITTAQPTMAQLGGVENEPSFAVAEILRKRRLGQNRRGGIEFSNTSSNPSATKSNNKNLYPDAGTAGTLTVAEKESALSLASRRFAPQTGVVAETNTQHMTSYIESELARLRSGPASSYQTQQPQASNSPSSRSVTPTIPAALPQKHPATIGQIHEIDLGPDTAARNAQRTEAAARRIAAGGTADEPEIQPVKKERIRLGRDGKPRPPPRKRKERDEGDVARDRLVEAILKESKVDAHTPAPTVTADEGIPADEDTFADMFQNAWIEAAQSRAPRRTAPTATTSKKPGDSQLARGPKLGGSRSARAAMHAAEKAKGTAKR